MNFFRASLLIFTFFLASAPAQEQSPTDTVKIKYDRFKDLTRFAVGRELVFGTIFHGIFLRASYSCPGQQVNCVPYGVDFSLIVASGEVKYEEPGVLKIRREEAGKPGPLLVLNMQHVGTERFDLQLPTSGEIYTAAVKAEDFIRMAESNNVNLQLDDIKFKLTPQNIQSLRALARRIKR